MDEHNFWEHFWDEFAENSYDNLRLLSEYESMHTKIAELIGSGNVVLDAGCGTGNLIRKIIDKNKVIGVDFSEEMIKKAKGKFIKNDNVELIKGDLASIDFPNEHFDTIVSINVLFNLDDPLKVINSFHNYLKKGGRLIISTPLGGRTFKKDDLKRVLESSGLTDSELEKVKKALGFNETLFSSHGMKYLPTEDEIVEQVEKKGFKVILKEKIYFSVNLLFVAEKL